VKTELTKLEDFLKRLKRSWKVVKKVNESGKRSHEETVQQKETESTRLKERRQYVARS